MLGEPSFTSVLPADTHSCSYKQVVMVGDGATDMQAKPPADAFIGYGGVVVRPAVHKGADWFVTHFDEVLGELGAKRA